MANEHGILAIGGDLDPQRLLLAYKIGIFPWYNEGDPIIWWSPDPRLVLFPDSLKISKSLRQTLRKGAFTFTFDSQFHEVITRCSSIPRKGQTGETWITNDMIDAYTELNRLGHAHSVEVWKEGNLVGGLYGLCTGGCFSGESMFSAENDASKAGFIFLVANLKKLGFGIIDCQVETEYLKSFGAELIDRDEYLELLYENKEDLIPVESWKDIPDQTQLKSCSDLLDYYE